jgi:hypothetical protein
MYFRCLTEQKVKRRRKGERDSWEKTTRAKGEIE